jgi:ATPase family associated with various cellular activities (AAA)
MRKIALKEGPAIAHHAGIHLRRELPRPLYGPRITRQADNVAGFQEYLHGPGGSGKSTLAFEFAKKLTDGGSSIRTRGGDRLDYVIFVSGKETEFNPLTGKEQTFALRQFASAPEQFAQILFHSGFLDEDEINSTNEQTLLAQFDELFSNFSGLIVIDDIDALYRRKVDSGEESLFMKVVQGSKRTRIPEAKPLSRS